MGNPRPRKTDTPRRIPIDARTIRRFLRIVSDGWTDVKAAKVSGISLHRWKNEAKRNPHFVRRWERAKEAGVATLEDAVQKRGVKGWLEPVISQGRIVTHVRKYSDTLLKMSAQARSKTYAPASPGDTAFEDAFLGASETLQSSLADLFARLETAELPAGDPRVGSSPQR